jgi:hypothetical protein
LKQVGNRWSLIASHLPTRTEGQVKNRFYSCIKKRLEASGVHFKSATNSRNTSEASNSCATSPIGNETVFDFRPEFNLNMSNGCVINFSESNTSANNLPQIPSFMIAKGPYISQEAFADHSTTQSSSLASNSPVKTGVNDPTDVISYDLPFNPFCRQFSQPSFFNFSTNQVDSHRDEASSIPPLYQNHHYQSHVPEIDSFFAEDLQSTSSSENESDERISQLSKRKAYLELALAKTLKEMKGF